MSAASPTAAERPRIAQLQERLLTVEAGADVRGARLEVLRPASLAGGSIGRLSRFSTNAGDALSRRAHNVSLVANLALFIGKGWVYYASGSMAILASLIDSAVDMVAQGVLMVANRLVTDRRDEQNVRYPAGRSKLESISVVACALVMGMAAAQVIQGAANELISAARDGTGQVLHVSGWDISIMLTTVVVKLALWAWCKAVYAQTSNVTVEAVAQDNLNDVLTNLGAIASLLIASLNPVLWVVDPIGAILLSLYIIGSWLGTAVEQVEMIIGRSADAEFLDVVREMAETHDPLAMLDCVRAYHFGPKFLVELEIVMAEETPLRDSHDCGILLQHKIEALPEVERAFVHIDYQPRDVDDHDPSVPIEYKTQLSSTMPPPPNSALKPSARSPQGPGEPPNWGRSPSSGSGRE